MVNGYIQINIRRNKMKNVWQRLHDSEEINMREDQEFRNVTIPEMNSH